MNKTEHEMLKEIIDFIGYTLTCKYQDGFFKEICLTPREFYLERFIDVRQIIFTPEFKDALFDYLENNYTEKKSQDVMEEIWFELHNPVDYLYNLLELGNH